MTSESYQANEDGSLSEDFDFKHPTMQECEQIIHAGLTDRNWEVISLASDENQRRTTIEIKKGSHSYKLEVFVYRNLAWSSGGRSKHEKRIQLTNEYSDHAAEFNLPKDGDHRCLLLGVYRRQEQVVICAWDAFSYRDHKKPSSCYVQIEAIADAMRSGLGQSVDTKQRLVCCFKPDLLAYYAENLHEMHERVLVDPQFFKAINEETPEQLPHDQLSTEPNVVPANLPRNRIVYGAPGTGKSHKIDAQVQVHFGQFGLFERITFHPDYTYAQFVGSYKPVPIYRRIADEDEDLLASDKTSHAGRYEPIIDYRFVPGPFLRMLTRALRNPLHSFVLVIEELNRANAPAVFGEVFQLLDRNDDGTGKFSVDLSADARDYMRSQGHSGDVRLPINLYIWATMNSADQGVLPLDAAFKRRWSFEYIPLNEFEGATADWMITLSFRNQPMSWNVFRRAVNDHLLIREIPEDRLLGPFFMRRDELESADAFKNKLLLYLRDDVVRHNPDALFRGNQTYGALVDAYSEGSNVFVDGVVFPPESPS